MNQMIQKLAGVIAAIVIGFLCGVGSFQMLIAGDVREHEVRLNTMTAEINDWKTRTDTRIYEVAGLVKEVLAAEKERQKTLQEFISVLKVQSELLQRRNP